MESRPGQTITLGARWLFPVESPPIANGVITVRDGLIQGLADRSTITPDLDLGNVAITPGFVNAHAHLELPSLPGESAPSENRQVDQIDWLRQVVAHRVQAGDSGLDAAVRLHLDQAIQAGTTTLADIATEGRSWPHLVRSGLRGVVFAEIIGLKRMRGLQTSQAAWDWISSIEANSTSRVRPGLSPHAPYTTAGWLYHRAAESGLPLSTHLAELPEERELLAHGSGPLREFLEDLGAWDPEWEPLGPTPASYMREGTLRDASWLIAHGNDFQPDEFWQLRPEAAPTGRRVAVAYCPRTHAFFGHAPHPYRAMLEAGVVVCIGTDSLASTPSLSVLDEIRFLHRRGDPVSGLALLTMATLFGAWALHIDEQTGSLRLGKAADLAVVELPDDEPEDPYRLLLDSDKPVRAACIDGQFIHGPESWRAAIG